MADPSATVAAAGRRHRVQLALDWVLAVVGLGVAVWQLAPRIAEVGNLRTAFGQLDGGWIAVAAVMSAASLLTYGELNRRFLTAGKDVASGMTVQAVTIAGNAIALTVPAAGGAVGTVYTVHALAERGVSVALAGWAIAMAGIVTGVVLVVLAPLAFVGVGLLGAPAAVSISVVLAVLIVGTGVVLLHRPRVRVVIVRWLVALARRIPVVRRRTPVSPAQAAWRFSDWIARRALTGRQWAVILVVSLLTWLFDVVALAASVAATGQSVPWAHVAFGYLAVQASIIANLTPGGTGPAEAGLLAALTAGGVTPGHAAIAVVIYRGVSWILPALVGWFVFVALVSRGPAHAGRQRRRPREHARHARGVVATVRSTRLAHNLRHWHRHSDNHARRRR